MNDLLADRAMLRWSGGAMAALLLHAGVIAVVLTRTVQPPEPPPANAVLLELPPAVPAPSQSPELAQASPAPESQRAEPQRAEPQVAPTAAEIPPPPPPPPTEVVTAEAVTPDQPPVPDITVPEPPKPEPEPAITSTPQLVVAPPPPPPPPPRPVRRPPERVVTHARAEQPARPVVQAAEAPYAPPSPAFVTPAPPSPAAAPAAPSAPTNGAAAASWRSLLAARLQTAKRFPERARSRGDQGVAVTVFTMDRSGHVLSASLVRSSGSELLDEEAVALIHRAAPLPPPPDDVSGATITLTVPVSFALR